MAKLAVLVILVGCSGKTAPSSAPSNTEPAPAAPVTPVTPPEPQASAPPACEPWTPEWPDGQADRVMFQDPSTGLYGYKTKAGAVAIAAQFPEAWSFWPGGFAAVHLPQRDVTDPKNPFAFIDTAGTPIALAMNFDNGPDYYQEGFFRITAHGKRGFMNDKGAIVIAPRYDTAWAFCHGKAKIEDGGATFYIDTTGAKTSAPPDAR